MFVVLLLLLFYQVSFADDTKFDKVDGNSVKITETKTTEVVVRLKDILLKRDQVAFTMTQLDAANEQSTRLYQEHKAMYQSQLDELNFKIDEAVKLGVK